MDVVWLKRDIRLIDHGPFADVTRNKSRKFCIVYLYEPDQLSEPTVHGSHIQFINEGIADLNAQLATAHEKSSDDIQAITLSHSECIETFTEIHTQHPIHRILAHEETGHMASYQRDKRVRKWCRVNNVSFVEYPQTGATRCLQNRDDFKKKLDRFMGAKPHPKPDVKEWKGRLITDLKLSNRLRTLPMLDELKEIPPEQRVDRPHRQRGGESKALLELRSFLTHRGYGYFQGISSPNSSWKSCSRLSPYLSWGHISLRHVIQAIKTLQKDLQNRRRNGVPIDGYWFKSLSSVSSRLHWRSHFIQKLESEPEIEKQDSCLAYAPLRRQPDDWNESHYRAWASGHTGYPFVDACMRCLHQHGWINFRMRAMLVSFATWNLWLDWKRIAPHLARVFLDYEPGIHYPQLQMQAGTTGINATRVYSVVKQGRDHDANGVFIRKYVPELQNVPNEFIHEPWKLTRKQQEKFFLTTGENNGSNNEHGDNERHVYPKPIVDESTSAKRAKERYYSVRKQHSTQEMAQKVYIKHGSRLKRDKTQVFMSCSASTNKKLKTVDTRQQQTLMASFACAQTLTEEKCSADSSCTTTSLEVKPIEAKKPLRGKNCVAGFSSAAESSSVHAVVTKKSMKGFKTFFAKASETGSNEATIQTDHSDRSTLFWDCHLCTFENDKPLAPVCAMCGTARA